jgi:hypothetical protein
VKFSFSLDVMVAVNLLLITTKLDLFGIQLIMFKQEIMTVSLSLLDAVI